MKFATPFAAALLALSACVQAENAQPIVPVGGPDRGFVNVGPDGEIVTNIAGQIKGAEVEGNGDGYGYVVGVSGMRPSGLAGVTDATNLTLPTAGQVAMRGVYRLGQIDNLEPEQLGMTFTLDADFDSGTLTGREGDLVVNGTISGHKIHGTVIYQGLRGALTGQIDNDRAVGVFMGQDVDTAFAGGFVINR